MDLTAYRSSPAEQQRTADLLRIMPAEGRHALDIGARDGHFSVLLAERFAQVTALDLTRPTVDHPKVRCVEGNAAALPFVDGEFDLVFCAEVLEHIPSDLLPQVCRELERVAGERLLIGVPYMQDIRVDRTTCYSCGKPNPPWGHVNSFDEPTLAALFPNCSIETRSFVGTNGAKTNRLAVALMDYAGNPYGTYEQDEPCIHCDQPLLPPPPRSVLQRVATKAAHLSRRLSESLATPWGNWIHVVLRKQT